MIKVVSFVKTLLPYSYKIGQEIPFYENKMLKITERQRSFSGYSTKVYKLETMNNTWFSESLITFYLEKYKGN